MASPFLLVGHGAASTAVQKKACRAAAAYAAFAATATTAAAAASAVLLLLLLCCCCCCCAAAELLLCCCFCHIRVSLLCVPKKIRCASRCQAFYSFFDTRFVVFGDLMEFRRFAHRKHSQSDAGMNLAFFTVDGIIGRIVFIAL